jgi:uncharacterized protein YrrD
MLNGKATSKGGYTIMLRKLHELIGYKVGALDDHIGSVDDFYFDDQTWTVRYVIVDTGSWLVGRRLLISTEAITDIVSISETLNLNLTKEQVENSPDIDLDRPVSRQHEMALQTYYGWPGYWTVSPMMGMPLTGTPLSATAPVGAPGGGAAEDDASTTQAPASEAAEVLADTHLRSVREVTGYHIHATDGDIGHVQDIFAGENDWIIRYFLVDTRNWWPGKHVLMAKDWVQQIEWSDRSLTVKVTRDQVKDSPEYDPREPVTQDYETTLHNYYLFPGYWM